jgi:hypothetical protein
MNADQDRAVIDLLQEVERIQRGVPQRRKMDAEFEEFMQASMKDRADLRRMLGDVSSELRANTEITKQVADILASFRVASALAKWIATIAAGVVAVYHGLTFWKAP